MSQHDTLTLERALREMIADVEDLKRPCSDPDSYQAARNSLYMSIAAKARAALSATQPAQAAQSEPLPEHADHMPEIAARLRLVARLAGCADAVPEDDRTAVGCIFSVLGNMRRALELKQAAQGAGEVVGVYGGTSNYGDIIVLYEDLKVGTKLYTQPAAGADVLDAVMYLLQDTRSYVCNCVVWRAKDGNGYTTDVAKAHRYTFDEAMRQHRSRDTDLPWPCDEVLPLARGHVDVQDVHKIRSLDDQRAAIAASGRQS